MLDALIGSYIKLDEPWTEGTTGIVRTEDSERPGYVWVFWAAFGTHTSVAIDRLEVVGEEAALSRGHHGLRSALESGT